MGGATAGLSASHLCRHEHVCAELLPATLHLVRPKVVDQNLATALDEQDEGQTLLMAWGVMLVGGGEMSLVLF